MAIRKAMGNGVARAVDATTLEVNLPVASEERVAFVSALENLTVNPADGPQK